jgi:DNA-binding NarL/FixJ family response regulator
LPDVPPDSPLQAAKQASGGLTPRERAVALLIAQGHSNRDIATSLVLSERTVEKHVENVMNKLAFNTRAQVAVWAAQHLRGADT